MGNVSVRGGDGGNDPSEVEYEEGEQFQGSNMEEVVQSSPYVDDHTLGGAPDLMGHSPPQSPRATQSPLMFTPQVPMVPLQRPEEMQNPSQAWMHNSDECVDMSCEQGIPTMITWTYGGKEVAVEGSWDDWKTKKPLQRSGKEFTIMKVLPSGVYQYRFLVDGHWRYAPDFPWAHDDMGNIYNILDLQEYLNAPLFRQMSLMDYIPENLESIAGFEPPQSPDSSYNNTQLGSEDYAKEPPVVPPQLQMTLLNAPSPPVDNHSPLLRPQHTVLNHLYVQKGKTGQPLLALGSTHRFLSKYVTVVLYKSPQR